MTEGDVGEQSFKALREPDFDVRAIVSSRCDNMPHRFLDMGFCATSPNPAE